MTKDAGGKLSKDEFVLRAIDTLVNQPGSKSKTGIHSRMSGFNEAFRKYFDGACPIEHTTKMREERTIAIFLSRGGVMLYRRESVSESRLLYHDEMHRKREAGEIPNKKKAAPVSGADALSQMQARR